MKHTTPLLFLIFLLTSMICFNLQHNLWPWQDTANHIIFADSFAGLDKSVLGKPQFEKCRVYLGIAQIAFDPPPPPPFTQTGTLGHFISVPTWANAIWTSIFTA